MNMNTEWHLQCDSCGAVGTYDGLVVSPRNVDDSYCRSCGVSTMCNTTAIEGPAPAGSMR